MKQLVLMGLWLIFTCSQSFSQSYNITDFGAKTGPENLNTEAINKAVETCSEKGGGTVTIPPGLFLTGTIILQDNVNLHLMPGAVLKASSNLKDFLITDRTNTENIQTRGIITSNNANNISITGEGLIDCSSDAFKIPGELHNPGDLNVKFTRQEKDYLDPKFGTENGPVKMKKRPGFMIHLINGNNILISGIKIINSPHWAMRLADSKNITIHNIEISNDQMVPNSDGIHFTCCEEVRVSDCNFICGDDALIFTTFGNKNLPTQNVVVTNCILESRSSGIRIGPGTGEIQNLTFSNIIIKNSNRGIGIFARDNPPIRDITFSNVIIKTRLHTGHWWGNGEPIHISSVKRNQSTSVGIIDNISFSNIKANSETGVVVYSVEPEHISNISFDKMTLHISTSKLNKGYGGNLDLRPASKKELSIFKQDIAGILAKNVNGLNIDFCKIDFEEELPDFFKANIHAQDCKNVSIRNNQLDSDRALILPAANSFNTSGNQPVE